jgi:hypothetical protein
MSANDNIYDRDTVLALAEVLEKAELVKVEQCGKDMGTLITVACPYSGALGRPRCWMTIMVLWHTGCRFTNYSQGAAQWQGTHAEAIQFLRNLPVFAANEIVRKRAI